MDEWAGGWKDECYSEFDCVDGMWLCKRDIFSLSPLFLPFNAAAAQGVDSGVAIGAITSKVGGDRRREIKVLTVRASSTADLRLSLGV